MLPNKENPVDSFFPLVVFFWSLTTIKDVMIIRCDFNLNEASSLLIAERIPSVYFPSEMPLYSNDNYVAINLQEHVDILHS